MAISTLFIKIISTGDYRSKVGCEGIFSKVLDNILDKCNLKQHFVLRAAK
jgi:hypothetical protein